MVCNAHASSVRPVVLVAGVPGGKAVVRLCTALGVLRDQTSCPHDSDLTGSEPDCGSPAPQAPRPAGAPPRNCCLQHA